MLKKISLVLGLCFVGSASTFADLSKNDVRKILFSAQGLTGAKAEAIITRMEETYGTVDGTQLKISALLHGSRSNLIGIFKDRKRWDFDVTFVPRGSRESVTVPGLVSAEVFKGGLKAYYAAYDWMWIALPNGMSIEDLDGYKTKCGLSVSPWRIGREIAAYLYPVSFFKRLFWEAALNPVDFNMGRISSRRGQISVYTFGIGLVNTTLVSFPKFHFSVNRGDLLHR